MARGVSTAECAENSTAQENPRVGVCSMLNMQGQKLSATPYAQTPSATRYKLHSFVFLSCFYTTNVLTCTSAGLTNEHLHLASHVTKSNLPVVLVVMISKSQEAGVVQKIKFGVSLVAGGKKNSTPNHKRALLRGLAGKELLGHADEKLAEAPRPGEAAAGNGVRSLPEIHLEVTRASAAAIEYIESNGGTVTCTHFNRLALRALVSGNMGEQKGIKSSTGKGPP